MMKWKLLVFYIQLLLIGFCQNALGQEVYKSVGFYSLPRGVGFLYAADRSFGDNYVFEHTDKNISVYLSKVATPSKGKKTLNNLIYASMFELYNIGFFQEKGNRSDYKLKFLGAKKGNFSWYGRAKQLKSDEKVYLLFYTLKDQIYRILIYSDTGKKDPPEEVKAFIENIYLNLNQ